jgi:hypothetical protein
MNQILICLCIFVLGGGCNPARISLPFEEQNQLIITTINIENDSSVGIINGARNGSHYLLSDQFHDSIFIDTNMINLIDKNISGGEIQNQYKKALKENNKLAGDSFNFIHIVDYSNKTPIFLSVSKPIKYLKYYIVNFFYSSWSSGYKSALLFEEGNFAKPKLIYRRVYHIN